MPVYLNEDQFGTAQDVVGFPNLLVCMGVVCMTNNALYGVHLTNTGSTLGVMAKFATWLKNQQVAGNQIVAVYGAANWGVRYPSANPIADWRAEMAGIKKAVGFAGVPCGFNTNVLVTNTVGNSNRYNRARSRGLYVEYVPQYVQSQCRIFYKKGWKMDYTPSGPGDGPPATLQFKYIGTQVGGQKAQLAPPAMGVKDTRDAQPAAVSNTGLHELDYAHRLVNA